MMLIGQQIPMIGGRPLVQWSFWAIILFLGLPRSNIQFAGLSLKLSIGHCHPLLLSWIRSNNFWFFCTLQCYISVLFCDNHSTIALSFNHIQHQRTKHIEIDVHFVREIVAKNQLHVQFISSQEQFADILTKGLSSSLFRIHCNNLILGFS